MPQKQRVKPPAPPNTNITIKPGEKATPGIKPHLNSNKNLADKHEKIKAPAIKPHDHSNTNLSVKHEKIKTSTKKPHLHSKPLPVHEIKPVRTEKKSSDSALPQRKVTLSPPANSSLIQAQILLNQNQNTTNIKLSNQHKTTLLTLFETPAPDRVLRFDDLLKLVKRVYGEYKATGGSRYRITINHIHSEVIEPRGCEPEKKVEKIFPHAPSTGTKGHKKGHNTRGKVLGYVVTLFRRAFERAGITPQALGLAQETHPTANNDGLTR